MHYLLRERGGHGAVCLRTHVLVLRLRPQAQEDGQRLLPHLQEDNQRHHQDLPQHIVGTGWCLWVVHESVCMCTHVLSLIKKPCDTFVKGGSFACLCDGGSGTKGLFLSTSYKFAREAHSTHPPNQPSQPLNNLRSTTSDLHTGHVVTQEGKSSSPVTMATSCLFATGFRFSLLRARRTSGRIPSRI